MGRALVNKNNISSNIKIVGNILSTTTISRYSSEDTNLIISQKLQENFGGTNDYIEYYVYDAGGNLLNSNYNYLSYKLPPSTGLTPAVNTPPNTTGNIQTTNIGIDSTLVPQTGSLYPIIEIDPVADLQNLGYSSGEFNIRYNFFTNTLSNYINEALFVKEISQDRTEVRLTSTTLTDSEIESVANSMIDKINNSAYYVDYLLNFGTNEQYVAINVALNKATTGYEVLFKLYQPLPLSVQEKMTLWIVEEKVSPYIFDINLDKLITSPPPPTLRGPNFSIEIPNHGTVSTAYNTYSSLVSGLQSLQNSSYQQILNLLATQSVNINVDYTGFDNFTFFGSAYQRLANFHTKVQEIEGYNSFITAYSSSVSTTSSLQTTINQYSSSINTIITQFDGYENYLYFESSSYAWPKSGSLKPYILLPSTDPIVTSWYNTLTSSAQNFDLNNYNNLEYAIPEFLKNDDTNQPFLTFLNMVGHYFDNIWVYLKAITDINVANNNLNAGISKDLVYEHLKSLGLHLYNSQAGESVDQYLIGANTGSSIWNNNTTITGSYLNNIPRKDLVAELYKRIYHNLPLLLKTKGTVAGLEHLVTTFGLTSSILNVKEFGGSTKSGLIKGYNNDKVRIIPNSIVSNTIYSGSVLSPLLSLQTFPTASAEFRENDMHYVDISFSPQTQIDTYISGAIASNNATWSLDDYIGDPRQQYSSSYPDLDAQRKLYFQTGVSGFAPFTSSLLDYNGFIRLIQYFDNSLFKMLEDFVPERTSLSTGVTINSPVLERNKVVYANPTNSTTQSVLTAQYPSSSISPQYGQLYTALQGDKKPFFTGELSGSKIDIYKYFIDSNYNPYLYDWSVWNTQHSSTQSIDINSFIHSDFNVLLNNVSKSIVSAYRQGIEYIWGTTGSILKPAELQDSYLSLRSYNISRYEGSKLTSLKYNTYTSASYTGSDGRTIQIGDISYGKTAAIDHNSYKLGWIKSISSQSLNFYSKTPISLEYLVDSQNQVTELNSYNNNIFEVQNTFKSGTPVALSISDMNQNRKDGEKLIWKGGYSFNPIIYRENGDVLTFRYDTYVATQSLSIGFLATDKNRYVYASATYYPPYSSIANVSAQNFFAINGVNVYEVYNGNNSIVSEVINFAQPWPYNNIPKLSYLGSNITDASSRARNQESYRFDLFNFDNFGTRHFTGVTPTNPTGYTEGYFNDPISSSLNNNVYVASRSSNYYINGEARIKITVTDDSARDYSVFKVALVVEKIIPISGQSMEDAYNNNQWGPTDNTSTPIFPIVSSYTLLNSFQGGVAAFAFNTTNGDIVLDGNGAYVDFKVTLPPTQTYSLSAGDYIRISLYFLDIQNLWQFADDVNIKISNAFWGVKDAVNVSTNYIYDGQYTSLTPIFTIGTTYQNSDTLNFNASGSAFFYSASFVGSSPNYSSVIDKMSIQKGDLIKFGKFEDPGEYYEVVSSSGTPYNIIVSNSIITGSVNPSSNFAVLRPKPDETSVILEGRKAAGTEAAETSLLVPYDSTTNLKNNIGSIIKSLKSTI